MTHARAYWQAMALGMLFVLPLGMFSSVRGWLDLAKARTLLGCVVFTVCALATALAAVNGGTPYIYIVTMLVLGAFFVPPLATALTATTTLVFLWLLERLQNPAATTEHSLAMFLVLVAPTAIAALQFERRLRELRFRLITDSLDELVWMSESATGQMVYVNGSRYASLWGRPAKSLGDDPLSLLHGVDPRDVDCVKLGLRSPTRISDFEFRVVQPDGSTRWMSARQRHVSDGAGPDFVVASARDITGRKLAEAKLQELSDFRKVMFEAAGHAIVCTDADGLITSWNPAAERLFGYGAQEMIGQQTPLILHDRQEVEQLAAQLSAELEAPVEPGFAVFTKSLRCAGDVNVRRWTYQRKDGQRFPGLLTLAALRDSAGVITGFIAMAVDLSAIERAQQAFDSAINDAGVPVLLADTDLRIVAANQAAHGLLGYKTGQLLNVALDKVIVNASDSATGQAFSLRHEIELGRARCAIGEGVEVAIRRVDGEQITVELGWNAVQTPDGRACLGLLLVDVTRRKLAEAEAGARSEALSAAKDAAEAAIRTRTRFVATVSHELRTPMNVVLGMTHLARQQQDCPPVIATYLQKIERSAQDLLEILNDVLDFSKIDAGRMGVEIAPFALFEVMRYGGFQLRARGEQARTTVEVPPSRGFDAGGSPCDRSATNRRRS